MSQNHGFQNLAMLSVRKKFSTAVHIFAQLASGRGTEH